MPRKNLHSQLKAGESAPAAEQVRVSKNQLTMDKPQKRRRKWESYTVGWFGVRQRRYVDQDELAKE